MKDSLSENRQKTEIADIRPGRDAPLWLLQKDDTRFLYISLFLSVIVHIILFAVMAATHIFLPLTGASQKFDLVWFSPTPVSAPIESSAPKMPVARHKEMVKSHTRPVVVKKAAAATTAKTAPRTPPPARTKALPISKPLQTAPVAAQLESPKEVPMEEPAEMVVSRYGGKVVDIVDKKADIPTFTVISSVKMKSMNARAVVQTIRETGAKTEKPLKTIPKKKPSVAAEVASLPKTTPTEKHGETVAAVPVPAKQTDSKQSIAQKKPVQDKISSASVAAVERPAVLPPVNRSINSFDAALAALSAAETKPAAREQVAQKQENETTVAEKASTLQIPSRPKPVTLPVAVEKPVPPEVKPTPQPKPEPSMIFQPPLTGDLKLVITGNLDVKVEVSFKPFPEARRSKPFTRREAENIMSILPIMARTKENVHEAVVEVTQEGIYTIRLRPANGKQGSVQLQLKIHESRSGAKTKNLGSRKIDRAVEIAKILMPEGILWNDESSFTGNMEDADSITKFNSDTGLMWREYQ